MDNLKPIKMNITMVKLSKLISLVLTFGFLYACGQNSSPDMAIKNLKISDDTFNVKKTDEEWKKTLSEEQYYVLREKGTERPFTGKYVNHNEKGIYTCAGCGSELFSNDMKFESHCGWPSFDKELAGGKITTKVDSSHGMIRTEILCSNCGGHLGHLFDDGPTETGLRYCVNSASLGFSPSSVLTSSNIQKSESNIDTLTLGGGCFWCVEAVYLELKGVISVEPGYSGGSPSTATYEKVSTGTTEHAEVIQIIYNSKEISLESILKVFFTVHDPTTLNRQGYDVGPQYRSVIFYRNEVQKQKANAIIAALTREKVFSSPIVTKVDRFMAFYKAEDYHLNYYNNNKDAAYCKKIILPKLEKLEKVFGELTK